MAEREKKPWQFSLKRLLGAMTIVCVWLAVVIFLQRKLGWGDEIVNPITVTPTAACLGSLVGCFVKGSWGAIVGAEIGMIFGIIAMLSASTF